MKKQLALLAALGAAMLFTGTARAVLLSDLIDNNATLQIGDKMFSDFALTSSDITPAGINVGVLGSGVDPDLWGLSFAGLFSASAGTAFEASLYYKVSVTDPAWMLSDIHQAYNLTARGAGGVITIGETVFDAGFGIGNKLAQSSLGFDYGVADIIDPPGELVQGDQLILSSPVKEAWVTKSVQIEAAANGEVGASILFQRFSQALDSSGKGNNVVPDAGATLLLLGVSIGLVGSLGTRLKSRAS